MDLRTANPRGQPAGDTGLGHTLDADPPSSIWCRSTGPGGTRPCPDSHWRRSSGPASLASPCGSPLPAPSFPQSQAPPLPQAAQGLWQDSLCEPGAGEAPALSLALSQGWDGAGGHPGDQALCFSGIQAQEAALGGGPSYPQTQQALGYPGPWANIPHPSSPTESWPLGCSRSWQRQYWPCSTQAFTL